ncbi:antirestriction protein ArdC [Rhizobium borbori]|uniref:Antirestriction protein ArdC n=1 Tax=Allorhizobium borbori TaxID=485907 RepID=A0A7W6K0U2_9HYPH|nr:antirestriction protein ArdC [Allorhizobium borbori]
MAETRLTGLQRRPCGIIRIAALCPLCRYRHKTHWTAAEHRVGRDLSRYAKDRTDRAREELIAELGSCFLCADLGIAPELEPRPDHASYLQSWLSVLAYDKRAIFQAAAHAQRAVSFLHSLQPEADLRAAA